jgi:tripartite-type tricarboxylate transporter receptor subunit TctC
MRIFVAAALALSVFAVAPSTVQAEDVATFYRNRVVTLVIGYGPGGGYDFYGRFVARHMSKHIPGRPTIVVQNMPGAGSLTSVNYLYNKAPRDGTVFGTFAREMPMMAILEYNKSGVMFEVKKLTWLGTASSSEDDPTLLFVRKEKLKKVEEALGPQGKTILIGSTAVGSGGNAWANLMRDVLGVNLRIVSGYRDSSDIFLAVERNEVDGRSLDYSAVKAGRPQWLGSGSDVHALLQLGRSTRHPDFPDAPTGMELARTDQHRSLVEIADLSNTLARPFAAPPGLPADRSKALQDAFMATMQDPEVLAEAKKLGIEISAIDGHEVLRRIDRLASYPTELLDEARQIRMKRE